MEKLSSTKPVPVSKRLGTIVLSHIHEFWYKFLNSVKKRKRNRKVAWNEGKRHQPSRASQAIINSWNFSLEPHEAIEGFSEEEWQCQIYFSVMRLCFQLQCFRLTFVLNYPRFRYGEMACYQVSSPNLGPSCLTECYTDHDFEGRWEKEKERLATPCSSVQHSLQLQHKAALVSGGGSCGVNSRTQWIDSS